VCCDKTSRDFAYLPPPHVTSTSHLRTCDKGKCTGPSSGAIVWIDSNPGKRQDIDNENTYNSVFTYKLSADFSGCL